MNGSVVVFAVMAVVLPLVLAEFGDWCPWLAARLVRWAARRLPDPASSSRYEEEWTANLNQVPGRLARLLAAVGYLAYLPAMRSSVRRQPTRPVLPAPALSTAAGRAVKYLASEAGIQQFLDIRAGMPAAARTHELAWVICPESRIFYPADSPALLPQALPQPYLPGSAIDYVTADPRNPNAVLFLSARTLDFSQPMALLLHGVLSHVGDHAEAQAIVGHLMQAMPSGSYLVLSERTNLLHSDQEARQANADTSAARLSARTARIIEGLELIEPRRISTSTELPGASLADTAQADMSCVVALKP